uniref:Uncharacterized protein n=1 Tax=viral metagenome TaxID=1070528 RepID=A0A6M3LFD1_9ZZZZ
MSAVEVEQYAVTEVVLDWMADHFDGDLGPAAQATAAYAEAQGFISGPLWAEVGTTVMMRLYRMRRIHGDRKQALRIVPTAEGLADSSIFATWYYAGNRYVQLGDMTKTDCKAAADFHNGLARGNGFERNFFEELANRLTEGQRVRDLFTPDDTVSLRQRLRGGRI